MEDKKKKEGIVAGQKQPLGAVWCKTRLFNSGGQFDQLCNLIGGAILARSTMLAHSRAIIAYGDGRPRSKVCVCVFHLQKLQVSCTSHRAIPVSSGTVRPSWRYFMQLSFRRAPLSLQNTAT